MESKLYKFTIFACLSKADHEFISKYISPKGEASLYKSIPIRYLERVRTMLKNTGLKFRVVYRGPRGHYLDQAMTWKQDARAFAVYPR